MNNKDLKQLLENIRDNKISVDAAMKKVEDLPFKDLGFATIDNHRELRVGCPEVIYGENKSTSEVKEIVAYMLKKEKNILVTRAVREMYSAVKKLYTGARYNEIGRVISIQKEPPTLTDDYIALVCAGTSDLPVVEEAYETAVMLGNRVERVVDVGVAGIHRLLAKIDILRNAKVIIVIAGMEGALASVVGGLVQKPVIAVPTSVGYGASFGGLAALLTMLNSCASGVSVVNIDNGFGAAYSASIINKL